MKFDFKLQIPKIGQKKTLVKEKIQINPDKYWIFVLIFNFLIILSAFVFGYFMFTNSSSEQSFEETSLNKQGVREKDLSSVLEIFKDRNEKSEKIKLTPSGKVDPSI